MNEDMSVKKMWQDFLIGQGQNPLKSQWTYTSRYFEVTKDAANNLAKLVLQGKKRATAASM
jgi:uncharacterized protein YhfF